MNRTKIFSMPIYAIEIIVVSKYMIGFGVPEIVVVVPSYVSTIFIDRERISFSIMPDIMSSGITEFGFIAYRISSIHPLVIRLVDG